MSSVVIAGDTSGSVTLQAPAVAGTTTLTLPSTSGTLALSGTGVTSVATSGGLTGGPITTTGTVSIDTNNTLGVGSYTLGRNASGATVNSAGTIAGSSLQGAYGGGPTNGGYWVNITTTTTGTWRNVGIAYVQGVNIDPSFGLWIRTA